MRMRTGLLICLGAASVWGCVQQQAGETLETAESVTPETSELADSADAKVVLSAPISTIKPGASVSVSHENLKPIAAGETGTFMVTVNEGYPVGTLTLRATGGDGLNVFGAETTRRVDMASGTTHAWRLSYSAEADGLYYINLFATAEPEAGIETARSFAVRVEVGDWQAAKTEVEAASMTTLSTGEPAVILEAQETIGE